MGAAFKLFEAFEGLVERDAIAADLERKHAELVRSFLQELREVGDTFAAQRGDPVVPKNSAPHSGALAWVRGLRDRIAGEAGRAGGDAGG